MAPAWATGIFESTHRITATHFFLFHDEDVKFSGIGDLLLDGLKDRVNGQAKWHILHSQKTDPALQI